MTESAEPGRAFAERYRLVRRIGVGGMGEVWEAEDEVLHRRVAVKLVAGPLRHDPAALARFEREARTGARLSHPHLATVYDYGSTDDGVYLVLELLEGETLAERLRRGPLPAEEAAAVVADAASALAVAHDAGIVHRDVKPSNLMLTEAGTKVMDFGIAAGDEEPLTVTGVVVGTPNYLAPERLEGSSAGPAADVYALGAVLFEAVAGRKAFTGATPTEVAMAHLHGEPPDLADVPGADPALADCARRAMARRPADRPSASELARCLQGADAPLAVVAAAPPEPEMTTTAPLAPATTRAMPTDEPPDRRGALVAAGFLGLALIGLAAGFAIGQDDGGLDPIGSTDPTVSGAAPAPTATPITTVVAPETTPPPPETTMSPPTTEAPPPEPEPGPPDERELERAAREYVQLLDRGEFETAWALTSPDFQAAQDRGSWEGFWSIYDRIHVRGRPEVDTGSGTVVLEIDFDGSTEAYTLTFVPGEDGTWLVDGPVGR